MMHVEYFPESDSIYFGQSVSSEELDSTSSSLQGDMIVSYDSNENVIGVEIFNVCTLGGDDWVRFWGKVGTRKPLTEEFLTTINQIIEENKDYLGQHDWREGDYD